MRDAAAVLARVVGLGGALHDMEGGSHPLRSVPHTAQPSGLAHAGGHGLPLGAGHGPGPCRGEHGPDHPTGPVGHVYPDGCGSWQQADVRTARDRLGWRTRIGLEESLADIWMEAACRM